MAEPKTRVKLVPKPVMTAHRRALKKKHLVYVLAVNRPFKYEQGRSRIVYIGTTANGVQRIAASVAKRSKQVLEDYGVKHLAVFVLTCEPRQGVEMWRKLERAALMAFKEQHGEIPRLNTQGKHYKNPAVFKIFNKAAIQKKLAQIENTEI